MSIKVYEQDGKVVCVIVGVSIRAKTSSLVKEKAIRFLDAYSPYMELCTDSPPQPHDLMIALCVNSADISVVRDRLMKMSTEYDPNSLVASRSPELSNTPLSTLCGTIQSTLSYAEVFLRLHTISTKHPEIVGYVYAYQGLLCQNAEIALGFDISHGKLKASRPPPQILSSSLRPPTPLPDPPTHTPTPTQDTPLQPLHHRSIPVRSPQLAGSTHCKFLSFCC